MKDVSDNLNSFCQVEFIQELKNKKCRSPLSSGDNMFVIFKTTSSVNFTYLKERSKIKFGGDKFVLSSTPVVSLFHILWQNLYR